MNTNTEKLRCKITHEEFFRLCEAMRVRRESLENVPCTHGSKVLAESLGLPNVGVRTYQRACKALGITYKPTRKEAVVAKTTRTQATQASPSHSGKLYKRVTWLETVLRDLCAKLGEPMPEQPMN